APPGSARWSRPQGSAPAPWPSASASRRCRAWGGPPGRCWSGSRGGGPSAPRPISSPAPASTGGPWAAPPGGGPSPPPRAGRGGAGAPVGSDHTDVADGAGAPRPGGGRRAAVWATGELAGFGPLHLPGLAEQVATPAVLPPMSEWEEVQADYRGLGYSPGRHV